MLKFSLNIKDFYDVREGLVQHVDLGEGDYSGSRMYCGFLEQKKVSSAEPCGRGISMVVTVAKGMLFSRRRISLSADGPMQGEQFNNRRGISFSADGPIRYLAYFFTTKAALGVYKYRLFARGVGEDGGIEGLEQVCLR